MASLPSTIVQREEYALRELSLTEPSVQNETQTALHIVPSDRSEELSVSPTGNQTAQPVHDDSHTVYPTGAKVWLALTAIYAAFFLNGLDITIVAVAVPSLTDYFKTVSDIGWYSAAYGMTASALIPFFGKACTVFTTRSIALTGQAIFLLGSIMCTFAPSSNLFIFGRALAGLGAASLNASCLTIISHMFPSHKRSLWMGLAGALQSIGLATAPAIGGVLIDTFGWRACFGINLPLCSAALVISWFFMHDAQSTTFEGTLTEKAKKLDLVSTGLIVPAIICLLLGVQWGGIVYGWGNAKIIVLLTLAGVLIVAFGALQCRLGDHAMIPVRIVKKRTSLAAMWFTACCSGVLAVTEYYTSIYWQGVRGKTPTVAGLLSVGLIIGLTCGCFVSGIGINKVGYFQPFMLATSVIAPIASGFLTTIDLDQNPIRVVALLTVLGLGVGLGLNVPFQVMAASLPPQEVSLGVALVGVAGGSASAIFISASATLFQVRLRDEIIHLSPSTNVTALADTGLSDLSALVGPNHLLQVLTGYNQAVVQTLYVPLSLACLSVIGSASMEWLSVKKKRA